MTGATGFVGKPLVSCLIEGQWRVTVATRSVNSLFPDLARQVVVGCITSDTEWQDALEAADVVIHLAARVHIMNDVSADPLLDFREANALATINLARQAVNKGVRRFIYLSSIKVNGESTPPGFPFTSDDEFVPSDPYGLSKYEAEQGLLKMARETSMEVVIIRPPLVYGEGVKANFRAMIRWVNSGWPLPLGAIHNKRSLLALDNLVSFIIHCIEHPRAANEVFLISDGTDVSTTELLQRVSRALNRPSRLVPVPVFLMEVVAMLIRKRGLTQRLFGSLQVDSSKARDLLGWKAPTTIDEALKKTVNAWLKTETLK